MDRSKPTTKNGPRWHSLVAKYSLKDLADATLIGCDRFVRVFHLDPGLLVGLWKRAEELAFVVASLHFHQLVERSTLGSAAAPYELPPHTPLLDDSPEYGLHGYQLHIDIHSSGTFSLCSTFRNLFTKKGRNGVIVMSLESRRPVCCLSPAHWTVSLCTFIILPLDRAFSLYFSAFRHLPSMVPAESA
uniref:F-box protein 15 n=1 Tax=Molossus molossus TaxID=27622 RepID=A0A7J8HHW3_MOLMO|nr:F-box protein 15 [Molossus molossus]